MRAWYSIEPKKLYNPVTSLLLADKKDWQGMRLVGQIRKDQGIDTPSDPNSAYKVTNHLADLMRTGRRSTDILRPSREPHDDSIR